MRIDTVAFRGIGPFIGEHRIDFSLLGTDALFLIEGPTGAGKSTILDAIAYGIYGEPAAANSDIGRMRSNHLSDSEKSWVEVVFTTRNATFRVVRSPEYQREKARGGGFTTEKPTLRVEKLDGSDKFRTVHESVRDGNIYLQDQVGLDRSQFAQTVLLPQGQFDKFLKSDTKERQPLLEKIFRTQKYTRIMELLNKRAKDSASQQELIKQELRESVSSLGGATGLDPDEVNELTNLGELAEYDQDLLDRIKNYVDSANQDFMKAEKELDELSTKYVALEEELTRRKQEQSAEQALSSTKSAFETVEKLHSSAISEIRKDYASELVDLGFDLKSLSANLSKEKTSALKAAKALDNSVELENSFDDMLSDLEIKGQEVLDAQAHLKELEEWALNAPKELAEFKARLKLTQQAANSVDALLLKRQPLDAEIQALEALEKLKTQRGPLEEELSAGVIKAEKLVEANDSLMRQRLANAVGQLASELKTGSACEVCGSTTHPKKAKISGAPVSDKALEAAANAAREATSEVATIKQKIFALNEALKPGKDKPSRTRAVIEKDLKGIEEQLGLAQQAREELQELDETVDGLTTDIANAKTEVADLRVNLATLIGDAKLLKEKVEKAKSQIKKDKAKYDSVAIRQETLEALIEGISNLDDLVLELEQARGAMVIAKEAHAKLPKSKSFGDVDAASKAVHDAKPARDSAVATVSNQKAVAKAFADGFKSVADIQKKRKKVISGAADLVNLAKLANGDNPSKQNLPTYVLQSMFEDVLVAANSRFEKVLEGRYKFETAEIQGSMAKKQGLGLTILDQRLNKSINPSALSGGESFCAALSLALGLSDVVRANQGGIAIDTFFIDEGFGSLDPTRLNQVMNMLTQLKAEGRTIGLISHVDDMKEAIQEKIEVRPIEQSGPSTLSVNWM
jgi:exonuclease SbcC